jgi:hypothetical protein
MVTSFTVYPSVSRINVNTVTPATPSQRGLVGCDMASLSDTRAHLRSSSVTRLSAAQSYTLVLQQDAPRAAVASSSAATDAAATAAVYKKVSIRLLPLFMAMLVLNWLDRSCLAFASIQMTQELHFTPEVCCYCLQVQVYHKMS